MEFKVLRAEFQQVLGLAQSVVEKKTTMPILFNILLEADGPYLKISATDLEVALHMLIPVQTVVPGKVAILARKLFDIVKEAPGEEMIIKTDENERVEITSKQSQYKMLAMPTAEFPKLPEEDGEFVTVETAPFVDMIDKVSFAMSTDDTRYYLNGVFVDKKSDFLVMVATDGHRLALTRKKMTLPQVKQGGMIVPRKGIAELRRLVEPHKAFRLSVGKRHVFVKTETQTLFIRLTDGDFPQYNRVIPEVRNIKIELPRRDLTGALRRVSLLSDEYFKGVRFYFCRDSLLVSAANNNVGEAKEDIVIDYKGGTLDTSFNSRYLLDVLSVIPDEKVVMEFVDGASPCVISCESDPEFCSVIMPMKL